MRKVVRIERVAPVGSAVEELLTAKGYKMADPGGADRARTGHAIFHKTLEDVAAGLQRGLGGSA
jgi:hypothetical protein